MSGDSEMRIEALKKAYAEVILNTSKEAASRVMAAERKALCFHNDLVSLKEESLNMFTRMKENFNSKITEAEAKSYNQDMKIEELEAQLSEAEGIIVDLRDELQQVYEQLDVMRHNQKQSLSGHVLGVAHECVLQKNVHNSSPLVIPPVSDCERNVAILHPTAPINKCSHASSDGLSTKSDLDECHSGKYDIASIILEDRETELYKNGCTQRIRAFERNPSNVDLSPLSEDHEPTVSAEQETKQEDSGNRVENALQNDIVHVEIVQKENKKRGKSSDELNRHSGKSLKTSSVDFSCSEAHLKTVSISVAKDPFSVFSSETDRKHVKVIPNASSVHDFRGDDNQMTRTLRRSARRSSRYKEAISSLKRPYHKKCIKSSQNFKNSMEETECYESVSDELGTSGEINDGKWNEIVAKTSEGLGEKLYHVSDARLFDVPISEEFDTTQSQTQNQSGNDRHLKFTFYRKRRKNVLEKHDENIVHDKSDVKKQVENRCLEYEVNADGGVMQIAHQQLVSLSGEGC